MMRFDTVFIFDHEEKTLRVHSNRADPLPPAITKEAATLPPVSRIASNMSKAEYVQKAADIIARIHAGDLYQANLTRKFSGEFAAAPDAFTLFAKLCEQSPAPYSAYMRLMIRTCCRRARRCF